MKLNLVPVITSCALASLSLPVVGAGDPPVKKYEVFEDGISPDDRYAVVWACPTLEDFDWEAAHSGEMTLDDMPDVEGKIENHLIELKSGRKLAVLASNYWRLPEGWHPNHEGHSVVWSPESDLVVTEHSFRFSHGPLEAVKVLDGKKVAQLEFGGELEALLRQRLAKLQPKKYAKDKDSLQIAYGDLKALGGAKFSLGTYAEIPKSSREDALSDESVATFTLQMKEGKLHLEGLTFAKAPEGPDDTPEIAAQRLAEADKLLNTGYQSLLTLLDETDREELKEEQKEWLVERDAVSDVWQRVQRTSDRTREFQKRRVELKEK